MGSSPGWTYRYVPTAGEWNAEFASKEDELGYVPVDKAGDTMLGPLATFASSSAGAGFNLPQGVAPGTPQNGDIWTDATGLYYCANGTTIGPLNPALADWKAAVSLATTGALAANTYSNGASGVGATLTGNSNGALAVDSVAAMLGQRVLVKNEVAAAHNGIYTVSQTGDGSHHYVLTRATDFNQVSNIAAGDAAGVIAGSTLADSFWLETAVVATVGTDAITFGQFGITYTSGTGLQLTGNQFSIDSTVVTLIGTQTLSNKTLVAPALGTPASGVMSNVTGVPIASGVSGLAAGVSTFLGTPTSANLAAALTDETGTGAAVFANSPALVTPNLGTPSALTLTNATNLPIAGGGTVTPTGSLSIKTTAGPFTVTTEDWLVLNKGSPSATTINLPTVASRAGRALQISDWAGNAGDITITPNGSETIMGLSSATVGSSAQGLGTAANIMLRPSVDLSGWLVS